MVHFMMSFYSVDACFVGYSLRSCFCSQDEEDDDEGGELGTEALLRQEPLEEDEEDYEVCDVLRS